MISYFFSSTMSCILHSPWYLQYAFNTQNLTRSRKKTSETPCHHVTSPFRARTSHPRPNEDRDKTLASSQCLGGGLIEPDSRGRAFQKQLLDADAFGSEPLYKFKLRAFGELPVGELAAIVEHSTKNAEVKQGHAPRLNKSRRAKLYMPH